MRHSLPLPETILKASKETDHSGGSVAPWLLGNSTSFLSLLEIRVLLRLWDNFIQARADLSSGLISYVTNCWLAPHFI